jgi:hypothetical protein
MHTIHEDQENLLRTLTHTPPDAPLPEAVVRKYWAYKRLLDRAGYTQLSPDQLALVVLLAGEGQAHPQDAVLKFIPELYLAGQIAIESPIEVVWRKKVEKGVFKGITGSGEVRVEIKGNEHTVPADTCKPL